MAEKPERDPQMLKLLPMLADSVKQPFMVDLQDVYLNIRMGISVLDGKPGNVERSTTSAESALSFAYQNPAAGHTFYKPEMTRSTQRCLRMENAMRGALENQELVLMFQPKVITDTDHVSGAEALLRWSHVDFGDISPVEFIPVAESSGMIVEIGHWVLNRPCRWTKSSR